MLDRLSGMLMSRGSIRLQRLSRPVQRSNYMSTVTLEEAQAGLADLIQQLHPGEEVLIMCGNQPVARLVGQTAPDRKRPRQLGTLQGTVAHIAPDFDAPLEDFREYME
jgi:antitoxin (DNA-binding transcriptional repressor) of toxin-antitoxin stability system